ELLCRALDVDPPCPPELLGSLAALPISDGEAAPAKTPLYSDPLQDALLFEDKIEVPIVPWPQPPKRLVRISAALYNTLEDYERLARALVTRRATARRG